MDAKSFYAQGVSAVQRRDFDQARILFMRVLKLDANNDKAWLWLSRTYAEPAQQIRCIEQALSINPNNPKAQEILQRLKHGTTNGNKQRKGMSQRDLLQISVLMQRADERLNHNDEEGAIAAWVEILSIQVDHEGAMRNAVKTLVKLGYERDAVELVWRAIDSHTTVTAILHTAMDLALRIGDSTRLETIRQYIFRLPNAHQSLYQRMAEDLIATDQLETADKVLKRGLELYPEDQKLLVTMGDLQQDRHQIERSVFYYNRAARINSSTPEGKEADKKLLIYPPVLTDRERGSIQIAAREVFGIVIFYLLMAWQDAGLNLARMDIAHWLGIVISAIGGYLLVTATSSAQQRRIADWLGGKSPEQKPLDIEMRHGTLQETTRLPIIPVDMRMMLGVAGGVLLLIAFWLVFGDAIHMLNNPIPVPDPIFTDF